LRFDSEEIFLRVIQDSLEVEGFYHFLCRPDWGGPALLFYPYPADSLLGGARTVLLKARSQGGQWRTAEFSEVAEQGARWRIPGPFGDSLHVRTIYRQRILATYARYIVTTTSAWNEPLRRARFEILLPPGARSPEFSFPFSPEERSGETVWIYETRDFLPDRDISVRWQAAGDSTPVPRTSRF